MSAEVLAGSETVSVVSAVISADAPIEEFHQRLKAAMQAITPPVDFEIILVDDATEHGAYEILTELADRDAHVGLIRLARPFGRGPAIAAGVDHAEGDAVVLVDPYLQDPPEVVAEMVAKWREGWDVVTGTRMGESTDFRLMGRRMVETLRSTGDEHRYSRPLVNWAGFTQFALEYENDINRPAPPQKASAISRMLSGSTVLSDKPLRLATTLGLVATAVAFLAAIGLIVGKIIDPSIGTAGYASMMTVILFLGGVQLLTIGILGQYLGRTYTEVKRRPLYVVADRIEGVIDLDEKSVDLRRKVALPQQVEN